MLYFVWQKADMAKKGKNDLENNKLTRKFNEISGESVFV